MGIGLNTETIQSLNRFWLGYRYTIVAMPEGLSLRSLFDAAALTTLGISEVIFPTKSIEMYTVPTLSTVEKKIPDKRTVSDLVLRAPIFRNKAFWDRIGKSEQALQDASVYNDIIETIMVIEFESQPGPSNPLFEILGGFFPLAVVICKGCQARAITPASANTQGVSSAPLEEIRFAVDDLESL